MSLLGFPSLIAGIILWTAGQSWFSHAAGVGEVLTIVSSVWIVFWVAIMGLIVWANTR